nr:hypothetical protein [Nannocystis sp.]
MVLARGHRRVRRPPLRHRPDLGHVAPHRRLGHRQRLARIQLHRRHIKPERQPPHVEVVGPVGRRVEVVEVDHQRPVRPAEAADVLRVRVTHQRHVGRLRRRVAARATARTAALRQVAGELRHRPAKERVQAHAHPGELRLRLRHIGVEEHLIVEHQRGLQPRRPRVRRGITGREQAPESQADQ